MSANTWLVKSEAGSSGAPKLQFSLLSVQTNPRLLNVSLYPLALCPDLLFAIFDCLGLSILALLDLIDLFNRRSVDLFLTLIGNGLARPRT
jgi:hypothetical protein